MVPIIQVLSEDVSILSLGDDWYSYPRVYGSASMSEDLNEAVLEIPSYTRKDFPETWLWANQTVG